MDTITSRQEIRRWQRNFNTRAPGVGRSALDFTLLEYQGKHPLNLKSRSGNRLFRLIFGSLTCPPIHKGTASILEILQKFSDQTKSAIINFREALAKNGRWFGSVVSKTTVQSYSRQPNMKLRDTQITNERRSAAKLCASNLKFNMAALANEIDGHVSKLYSTRPTRQNPIDSDGILVDAANPGNPGYKTREFRSVFQRYIHGLSSGPLEET